MQLATGIAMQPILVLGGELIPEAALRAVFGTCHILRIESIEEIPTQRRFAWVLAQVGHLGSGDEVDRTAAWHELQQRVAGARVVAVATPPQIRDAVGLVREGAADYLTAPVSEEELQLVREGIERRERLHAELGYLRNREHPQVAPDDLESNSAPMLAALRAMRRVAPTRSTVLLTGETGTGKSFLARSLHRLSSRSDRQLVTVHCGAVPDTLLESELFGHERGAFTGADRRRLGKFEIAHGGTLFLDEIATISPAMQVKLLNVLQERTIQRLGSEHAIEVDVRIVAATNIDLEQRVADGSFRADLFYRLNVFPIELPPLRDRREDLPMLVRSLLEQLSTVQGQDMREVHPDVMQAFMDYDWPGNVRELGNVLERALILEASDAITPDSIPEALFVSQPVGKIPIDTAVSLAQARNQAVEHAERAYLQAQLTANSGRIDATAAASGITPRQLHKLMSRHGLKKETFRALGSETPGTDS